MADPPEAAPSDQAAGVLTMLAVRISEMERAVRREIETGKKSEAEESLDEADEE